MSESSSLQRQERRILDLERFYDILGIFSDELAQGLPFTLEPLQAPCLAVRGCGITEDESVLVLDFGEVETDALSCLTLDTENIGLDEAAVSVGSVGFPVSAQLSPDVARLRTGQTAKLQVGLLGSGSPGLAVAGEVLLQIHRTSGFFLLPIRVRGVSARIAPSPCFHCDGRPCPSEHNFGRVEARELVGIDWQEDKTLLFLCTVANRGGRSCDLSVSIEGDGFELALGGHTGGLTAEIPPGGSIDVKVRPAFESLGPHCALLRLVVEGARNGPVVVTVRLVVDVYSAGPLFTIQPGLDRIKAVRGCRCLLPATAANLGTEGVRIKVFPMLGERALRGAEIDLPPGDGVTPAFREVDVGIETEGLVPGEHSVEIVAEAGVCRQINPAATVVLSIEDVVIEPPDLEFGSIPLGERGERAVLVRVPFGLPAMSLVQGELASVLTVEAQEGGRFVVRVTNDAEALDEPRCYSGVGFRITVPPVEFSRDIPVSFRRLRPRLVVPDEVTFGTAVFGQTVSMEVRLANEGDSDLKIRASSVDPCVTFAPARDILIPGGTEQHVTIVFTLPDIQNEGASQGMPFSTSIVLTGDSPRLERHLAIKGMIVEPLNRLCSLCKAINAEPGAQDCWFCQGSLAGARLATMDKVGRCSKCGSMFSNEYSFCPNDGGDLRPFSKSS